MDCSPRNRKRAGHERVTRQHTKVEKKVSLFRNSHYQYFILVLLNHMHVYDQRGKTIKKKKK